MDADILVIGCGPAGIQAAIHASRKKASVVVAGKQSASALSGALIENYMGVPATDGDLLLSTGATQAREAGATVTGMNILSIRRDGDVFEAVLEDGEPVRSKAVVFATGISRRKLGVPGEKEFFGKGVSYCAVCDCNFYKGRRAVIVGNDSEAAVSAEMMTSYASETSWVFWEEEADPSLISRAKDAGVSMHRSRPVSIDGSDKVESITLEDGTVISTDGVFIELGAKSAADLAMDVDVMPEMDDSIKVDQGCFTGVPGVYACGDVTGKPWQMARAVGQGCVAGTSAADFVKGLR